MGRAQTQESSISNSFTPENSYTSTPPWKDWQLNNAISALINPLISRDFQSSSIGPGGSGVPDGQAGQGGQGSRVAGWSGGQKVSWSGGPGAVVRVVKVFIMASMVQVVQKGPCGPYGPGDQASQGCPGGQVVSWSGGQVVRVVSVAATEWPYCGH